MDVSVDVSSKPAWRHYQTGYERGDLRPSQWQDREGQLAGPDSVTGSHSVTGPDSVTGPHSVTGPDSVRGQYSGLTRQEVSERPWDVYEEERTDFTRSAMIARPAAFHDDVPGERQYYARHSLPSQHRVDESVFVTQGSARVDSEGRADRPGGDSNGSDEAEEYDSDDDLDDRHPGQDFVDGNRHCSSARYPSSLPTADGRVGSEEETRLSESGDWKRPDMHMFKTSSFRGSVTSERSSRLDPHTYHAYAAGILYSTGRSERFLRLQNHFAVLERVGELSKETGRRKQSVSGTPAPEQVGEADRGTLPHHPGHKEELHELCTELEDAQRRKEFFYQASSSHPHWQPERDFGLQNRQHSLHDKLRQYTQLQELSHLGNVTQRHARSKKRTVSFGNLRAKSENREERETADRRGCVSASDSPWSDRTAEHVTSYHAGGGERGVAHGRSGSASPRELSYLELLDSAARKSRQRAIHGTHIDPARNEYEVYVEEVKRLAREEAKKAIVNARGEEAGRWTVHAAQGDITGLHAKGAVTSLQAQGEVTSGHAQGDISSLHVRSLSAPHSSLKHPALSALSLPRSQSSKESFFGLQGPGTDGADSHSDRHGDTRDRKPELGESPEIVVDSLSRPKVSLKIQPAPDSKIQPAPDSDHAHTAVNPDNSHLWHHVGPTLTQAGPFMSQLGPTSGQRRWVSGEDHLAGTKGRNGEREVTLNPAHDVVVKPVEVEALFNKAQDTSGARVERTFSPDSPSSKEDLLGDDGTTGRQDYSHMPDIIQMDRISRASHKHIDTGLPITQATPRHIDTGPSITQATPRHIDTGPPITQATPRHIDTGPPITQATPRHIDTGPPITQATPRHMDTGPPVSRVADRVTTDPAPTHQYSDAEGLGPSSRHAGWVRPLPGDQEPHAARLDPALRSTDTQHPALSHKQAHAGHLAADTGHLTTVDKRREDGPVSALLKVGDDVSQTGTGVERQQVIQPSGHMSQQGLGRQQVTQPGVDVSQRGMERQQVTQPGVEVSQRGMERQQVIQPGVEVSQRGTERQQVIQPGVEVSQRGTERQQVTQPGVQGAVFRVSDLRRFADNNEFSAGQPLWMKKSPTDRKQSPARESTTTDQRLLGDSIMEKRSALGHHRFPLAQGLRTPQGQHQAAGPNGSPHERSAELANQRQSQPQQPASQPQQPASQPQQPASTGFVLQQARSGAQSGFTRQLSKRDGQARSADEHAPPSVPPRRPLSHGVTAPSPQAHPPVPCPVPQPVDSHREPVRHQNTVHSARPYSQREYEPTRNAIDGRDSYTVGGTDERYRIDALDGIDTQQGTDTKHGADTQYGQLRKWTAVADIYRNVERSLSPTREAMPLPVHNTTPSSVRGERPLPMDGGQRHVAPHTGVPGHRATLPDNNSSISSTDTFIVKDTDEEEEEGASASVSQLRAMFEKSRTERVSKSKSDTDLKKQEVLAVRPRAAYSQASLQQSAPEGATVVHKPSVLPRTVSGDLADIRRQYGDTPLSEAATHTASPGHPHHASPSPPDHTNTGVQASSVDGAHEALPTDVACQAWVEYTGRPRYDPYLPPEDILREVTAVSSGRKLDVPRRKDHRPSAVSHMTLQYLEQIASEWQHGGRHTASHRTGPGDTPSDAGLVRHTGPPAYPQPPEYTGRPRPGLRATDCDSGQTKDTRPRESRLVLVGSDREHDISTDSSSSRPSHGPYSRQSATSGDGREESSKGSKQGPTATVRPFGSSALPDDARLRDPSRSLPLASSSTGKPVPAEPVRPPPVPPRPPRPLPRSSQLIQRKWSDHFRRDSDIGGAYSVSTGHVRYGPEAQQGTHAPRLSPQRLLQHLHNKHLPPDVDPFSCPLA